MPSEPASRNKPFCVIHRGCDEVDGKFLWGRKSSTFLPHKILGISHTYASIESYEQWCELLQCTLNNFSKTNMVKIFHTLRSLWGPQVMHPMQHQVKLSFPNWFHRRRSDSALEKLQLYFFPMNKTASQKNMNLFSMFGQSIPECRMHTSPQLLPGQPITCDLGLFAIGLWAMGRWTGESRAVNSRQTSHRNRSFEGKPFFLKPELGSEGGTSETIFLKVNMYPPSYHKLDT